MNYIERAFDASKYGEFSPEPYLEVMLPTVADPSLAPAGKHILSIYAQFAPYKLRTGTWNTRASELAECIVAHWRNMHLICRIASFISR